MQPRGSSSSSLSADDEAGPVNSVRLVGRVSAEPEHRELPSGDKLVLLRVIVSRPVRRGRSGPGPRGAATTAATTKASTPGGAPARQQVDTIDVTCWTAVVRRAAAGLQPGQVVEVHGALRRRFYRAGASTQSRYEVEASLLRKVGGPPGGVGGMGVRTRRVG
ncbi:single-stranded DNA-binding protein [Lapillicoccus sp.]|uniref:single-stranded DNA-binding protein n=1 Tax=Lapillicoccus sp. TaxID=1909287 RepID=UPI003983040F